MPAAASLPQTSPLSGPPAGNFADSERAKELAKRRNQDRYSGSTLNVPQRAPTKNTQTPAEQKQSNPQEQIQKKRGLARFRNKKNQQDNSETTGKESKDEPTPMPIINFAGWLFLAILCDIGSLIPYVGLIFSWPFAVAFGAYKFLSKTAQTKSLLKISGMSFLAEGFFSSIPACTADVLLTFILSRKKSIKKKLTGNNPQTSPAASNA